MKRRLKIIIAILTIIFPSSALPVLRAMAEQTAMPSQTPAASASQMTIQLAGLHAPVTVRRDERGIPYIEAANESDLNFAQGYVTASDRLWQMDLLRRTAHSCSRRCAKRQ